MGRPDTAPLLLDKTPRLLLPELLPLLKLLLLTECQPMAFLVLLMVLLPPVLLLELVLLLVPLPLLSRLDMVSVRLMLRLKLKLMLMPMLDTSMPMPALSPPLPPSARVSQLKPATRFLSALQERLPRLSARKSLMSRSSRTVLKLSALLALSNLFSNLTLLLLLELTQRLDPLLLSPPTELLLSEPLLPDLL